MKFKLTIVQKGLLLVLVPLLFELTSVAILAKVSAEAESQAEKSQHLFEVSDATNELLKILYTFLTTNKMHKVTSSGDLLNFHLGEEEKCHVLIVKLKKLTQDNPKQFAIVKRTEDGFYAGVQSIKEAAQAYNDGDMTRYHHIHESMGQFVKSIASDELVTLNQEARDQQAALLIEQQEKQTFLKILLAGVVASSVLFSIALSFVITSSLTKRLQTLGDNALKVARGQELPALIGGDDEIAEVDRVFHHMVDGLEEAHYRERAILENAQDVICSISRRGSFEAVSKACHKVFGYGEEELIGKHFVDLVHKDDVQNVITALETVKGDSIQFEVKMLHKSGTVIWIAWSAYWSKEEGALFCVLHDVTERKEAERLRQEVINMVTHDLRTPLTAIRHTLEMLGQEAAGPVGAENKKLISRAEGASKRMVLLISDLLDIEKIKSGQMQLSPTRILVDELFELTNETVAGLVVEKQIRLVMKESDLQVTVDPDRIAQVLVNLVSNAVKFSEAGRSITLSARALPTQGANAKRFVEISVQDQGRGIPANLLETIFEQFQQVERGDGRAKGGTGLGLTICRALVEMHGGKIWAESRQTATLVEPQGSTFKFTLPV